MAIIKLNFIIIIDIALTDCNIKFYILDIIIY